MLDVALIETNSLGGESIQVWGLDDWVSSASRTITTPFVRVEKYEIQWAFRHFSVISASFRLPI